MRPFESCFLFLDNPDGGVENLAEMRAAGFAGVFCNVRDYPPPKWEAVILPRARSLQMFCGAWGRTMVPDSNPPSFDPGIVDLIVDVADDWDEPLIVNAEKEIDGSGSSLTSLIAQKVGSRSAAVSVEPVPFASVDWKPVGHLPVLPQIFPAEQGTSYDLVALRKQWHAHRVRCVYFTFGTYAGMKPEDFKLQEPYSLFTGDAIGAGAYALWSATSSGYKGCQEGDEDQMPVGTAKSARDAFGLITDSQVAKKWQQDNPGEWKQIEDYDNAASRTPAPTGINTEFGLGLVALIKARRYADGSHS